MFYFCTASELFGGSVCVCVSLGIACRVFCEEGNQKARTFCGLKGSHWNQMLKKHA